MNAMCTDLMLHWKGQDGHEIAVYQYPKVKIYNGYYDVTLSDLGETLIEYDDHRMLVYAAELVKRQGLNYDSATHEITCKFKVIQYADSETDPKPIQARFARAIDRISRGLAAKKRAAAGKRESEPAPPIGIYSPPPYGWSTPDDLRWDPFSP